jgi:hypothetical protein
MIVRPGANNEIFFFCRLEFLFKIKLLILKKHSISVSNMDTFLISPIQKIMCHTYITMKPFKLWRFLLSWSDTCMEQFYFEQKF